LVNVTATVRVVRLLELVGVDLVGLPSDEDALASEL
jgi:hypothetical protein